MHTVSHIIRPEIYSYRRHNTSTVSVTQEAFTNCLFLALYRTHCAICSCECACIQRNRWRSL